MANSDHDIPVEGGGQARGGGDDIHEEIHDDDEGGGALVPAVYDVVNNIPQEMEVRFMDFDSEGNLYTISGIDTVQRWYKGQIAQASWSALRPVNAFVVKRSARFTHAFFAHDKGETKMWRCYNSAQQPYFRQLVSLQTERNRIWNLLSCVRDPRDNTISCLCLSDDGNFIYAGSKNYILYVWWIDNLGGMFVERIRHHMGEVLSLAVGPRVVFSGSTDGGVRIWKREQHGSTTNKVRHTLIGMFLIVDSIPMKVNALVFHKSNENSGWLYAGSSDRKVRCWKNLRVDGPQDNWPEPELMISHEGAITCLALCSGPFVFSGSKDKKVCVWRRGDGDGDHTLEVVLTDHENPINCIATQLDDWTENDVGAPRRWILYSGSLEALRIWRVYEEPLALHQ